MIPSEPRAFCIHPDDNVATLIDDAPAHAQVRILGKAGIAAVSALETIAAGHKIALVGIPAGRPVIKFGVEIGKATTPIAAGGWVHLHCIASNYDERSQTLDHHTGAVTDTIYE